MLNDNFLSCYSHHQAITSIWTPWNHTKINVCNKRKGILINITIEMFPFTEYLQHVARNGIAWQQYDIEIVITIIWWLDLLIRSLWNQQPMFTHLLRENKYNFKNKPWYYMNNRKHIWTVKLMCCTIMAYFKNISYYHTSLWLSEGTYPWYTFVNSWWTHIVEKIDMH